MMRVGVGMLNSLKYKAIALLFYAGAFFFLLLSEFLLPLILVIIGFGFWQYGKAHGNYARYEKSVRGTARAKAFYDRIFYKEYDKFM